MSVLLLASLASAVPQRNGPIPREEAAELQAEAVGGFVPVRYIESCATGEAIAVNIDSIGQNVNI